MLQDFSFIIFVSLLVGIVEWVHQKWENSPLFMYIPKVIWLYLLPFLLLNLPLPFVQLLKESQNSAPSQWIQEYFLLFSIIVFTTQIELKQTIREFKKIFATYLIGIVGLILGVIIVSWMTQSIFQKGEEFLSMLLSSWIGGSTNMIFMKNVFSFSDANFQIALLVDTVLGALVWVPLLLLLRKSNKWNTLYPPMDEISIVSVAPPEKKVATSGRKFVNMLIFIAITIGILFIVNTLTPFLSFSKIFSGMIWSILLTVIFALVLSRSSSLQERANEVNKWARYPLYFYIVYMGSSISFGSIFDTTSLTVYFIAGAIVLFIHMFFLLVSAKVFHLSLAQLVVCSMASIGGIATAPVIVSFFQPKLVSLSIIFSLIGYVISNYLSVMIYYLVKNSLLILPL